MVTAEELRSRRFFQGLDQAQLEAIAAITEEVEHDTGEVILQEGLPVQALHVLLQGGADLYYSTSADPHDQRMVCEIEPGEAFGISALIEPYALTGTVETTFPSRVLKINARALRALFEKEPRLGYLIMAKVAQTAMMRLHCARLKLAVTPAY